MREREHSQFPRITSMHAGRPTIRGLTLQLEVDFVLTCAMQDISIRASSFANRLWMQYRAGYGFENYSAYAALILAQSAQSLRKIAL